MNDPLRLIQLAISKKDELMRRVTQTCVESLQKVKRLAKRCVYIGFALGFLCGSALTAIIWITK